MSSSEEALAIHNALLEKSCRSLFSSDFNTYQSCFFLPQEIETFEGSRWLLETSDLREIFDGMREKFKESGITDMVRRSVVAEFTGPTTIEATHETRLLAKNQIIAGPYPSFSILQKIDDLWQVSHSQYAVGDENGQSTALLRSGLSSSQTQQSVT